MLVGSWNNFFIDSLLFKGTRYNYLFSVKTGYFDFLKFKYWNKSWHFVLIISVGGIWWNEMGKVLHQLEHCRLNQVQYTCTYIISMYQRWSLYILHQIQLHLKWTQGNINWFQKTLQLEPDQFFGFIFIHEIKRVLVMWGWH